MTMAAAIESQVADAQAWSKASRIASVDILHDLVHAEAIWRGLEDRQQFSTPYQRFDFLGSWQRRVGAREGLILSSLLPTTPSADRCCCFRSRSGIGTAFVPPVSWVASTPPTTWRSGTGILRLTRPRWISTR